VLFEVKSSEYEYKYVRICPLNITDSEISMRSTVNNT